ncbi:MAG: T9SS type A sorting domain-containing protein [Flavobacteriales bacterium]|nr:T9SS type A sorting domain-containing protein [Flavobacteriales bacterium]
MRFPDPNFLRYTKMDVVDFGPQNITEGRHTLKAWTELPNGQADLKPDDDVFEMQFTAMSVVTIEPDTAPDGTPIGKDLFCDDFEDPTSVPWVAANPYTLSQMDPAFEFGTPSTTNISGANSGANAWVTNLDGNYSDQEEGMLISPFFRVSADSCYLLSFSHNYHITDELHDGGTVRFLLPNNGGEYTDEFWSPLGKIVIRDTLIEHVSTDTIRADTIINNMNDTIITAADTIFNYDTTITNLDTIIGLGDTIYADQIGWYNTRHILSIPDNSRNAGWTGTSNGWTTASALLIPTETYNTAIIWRFESDGSVESEGWGIDDFCVEKLPPSTCNPVSTRNVLFEKSELYLGQNIPNPATYSTIIPFYLPKSGMVQFEVINLLGQPVYQENVSRPKGDGIIDLDLSSIAKGIYYYTLTLDGNRATNKMVIAK